MTRLTLAACLAASTALPALAAQHGMQADAPVSYGERPFYLIDQMKDGALKEKLMSCAGQTPEPSKFSIGHRGAALMFPEHTVQSYTAAARYIQVIEGLNQEVLNLL